MSQGPMEPHHHMAPTHYGPPSTIMAPMYSAIPPLHQQVHAQQHHHPSGAVKRPRSDSLGLSIPGMPEMQHAELGSIQQSHLEAAYGHGAGTPVTPSAPLTHHHHRLPESSDRPSKLARRDDGGMGISGGAPSVVGQEGMPSPAPRPRGPKLKFTPEDDQLLIDLKEQKNLTWKQIADFFPGRSSGTLQVRYCTRLKAKTTLWTDEAVCGHPKPGEQ